VWKLDRLAWSMKQLIETMENLQVRGIGTTVNYHEAG
jgi:DNA invertase Pin-like site-specific DNA recombinase